MIRWRDGSPASHILSRGSGAAFFVLAAPRLYGDIGRPSYHFYVYCLVGEIGTRIDQVPEQGKQVRHPLHLVDDDQSAQILQGQLRILQAGSGSMGMAGKLPLLKPAFRLLVDQLRPDDDRVVIVAYAGDPGLVLDSTPGCEKTEILQAGQQAHQGTAWMAALRPILCPPA